MVNNKQLSTLAREYFGGLAHVHTLLSNHRGHRESDLSAVQFVDSLVAARLAGTDTAPLQYILFNEHPSDPSEPRQLGPLSLRGRQLLKQRHQLTLRGARVLHGLEVSLLPNGQTDLTPRLADNCTLVIASRHALPANTEHDPQAIMKLFYEACDNPSVDVLGHPQRYIEDCAGVDWSAIFRRAASTGTAVEINLNCYPKSIAPSEQQQFWVDWLRQLAASQAHCFIGTDIHHHLQLDEFIYEWQHLDAPSHNDNQLARFIKALYHAEITPERIITSTEDRLKAWLAMDKSARRTVPLEK